MTEGEFTRQVEIKKAKEAITAPKGLILSEELKSVKADVKKIETEYIDALKTTSEDDPKVIEIRNRLDKAISGFEELYKKERAPAPPEVKAEVPKPPNEVTPEGNEPVNDSWKLTPAKTQATKGIEAKPAKPITRAEQVEKVKEVITKEITPKPKTFERQERYCQ